MMNWVYKSSLRLQAKRAFEKGNGKWGKYAVCDGYITALSTSGKPQIWIKVIDCKGPIIKAKTV